MISLQEVVVVEGKYDKIRLSSLIDSLILETNGFGIFKDTQKMELLKKLAATHGILVLTDSDGAGFVIRGYLSSSIPKEQIRHGYIPDVFGKEKRKEKPSKEGKLGVEGMETQALLQAIRHSGAHILGENGTARPQEITTVALYTLSLSGTPHASQNREKLLEAMQLPAHMSTPALLGVLNATVTLQELSALCETLDLQKN